ncbi:uncharacterized protein PgNI_06883 [Pyricularia grisea]|uniref:Alb1-domain-containing protein n=1 Tax=Pyricularia grisea TaxID=148305 RepID=A0A6P8B056_PYRGI|nr:uncharacterized protein PgNI_06883 [Pyricularia grisea]TLD08214.1 hypothetical protein PgNI_06883 [Pyricularia grisea]
MAKKAPSKHSRAARRATSPSINTDKSLKEVRLPEQSINQRPAVLAAHHHAGVSKKQKHRKSHMTSKMRKRQEKSMDRAEAVMDRTAKKTEKSFGQAKTVEGRRKAWDDINAQALGTAANGEKKSKKQLAAEAEQAEVDKFFANDDDDAAMGNAPVDGIVSRFDAISENAQPATAATGDDDEML